MKGTHNFALLYFYFVVVVVKIAREEAIALKLMRSDDKKRIQGCFSRLPGETLKKLEISNAMKAALESVEIAHSKTFFFKRSLQLEKALYAISMNCFLKYTYSENSYFNINERLVFFQERKICFPLSFTPKD